MNHLSRVFYMCLAVCLAACGGGGGSGSAGNPVLGGAVSALFTSAPSDLTLEAGGTKASAFVIGGGKRPYTVASSNGNVVSSGQNGDAAFILTGVRPGSAAVVVKDASGQSVNINVTTRPNKDLTITVPSALILSLNDKQPFVVAGGAEPFTAVSNNPAVAQVSKQSGSDFSIQALRLGTTQISVTDANGGKVSVDVTVSPGVPPFSTAPSTLSLFVGVSQTYELRGGVAPYTVRSSNPGTLSASLIGKDVLELAGLSVGVASVVVTDFAGTSVTVSSVSVTRAQQLVAIVPNPVVLRVPLVGQPVSPYAYPIAGGKSPFVARSSDEAVARVSVDSSSTAPSLSVTPVAAGSARLLLTDSLGEQFLLDLTVSSAAAVPLAITPSAATAVVGDVLTFTISGGTPDVIGAYTVRSNNPSVLTVPSAASSSFDATLVSAGATVLTVVDSQGQVKTVTVDVSPANSALRLSPSSITVNESLAAVNLAVSVVGGSIATGASRPVRVFSSDVARISPSASGNSISLSLGSNGKLCFKPGLDTASSSVTTLPVVITAVDDLGASATMTVKILDDGGTSTCPNN